MNATRLADADADIAGCDPSTAGAPTFRWQRSAPRVALFSAIIGVLLCIASDRSLRGLLENVVYSECIGFSIYATITFLRRRFPPRDQTFTPYLVRGVVAVPFGLFVGLNLGALVTGNPIGFAVINQALVYVLPVSAVSSAGVMYFLWSRKRLADVAAAHAQARRQMAEARLRMLQAQIEPHMLFNTLANLRILVDVEPARAQTMIDQLIVYLRGTLAASRSTTTTLAAEFAQLDAYLALMQVRMATRLCYILELPDALRDHPMPPMLLQPLVENAIRHGLEPKIEGGTVRVTASATPNALTVDVVDDGIGLSPSDDEPGYGLVHVRERLRTLHGDGARLTIEPGPAGGVRARVEMPR